VTPRKTTRLIVVHCSATPPDRDIGVKEITGWHLARGFLSIGYHWVIRRDGTLETGRREDLIGAHAQQVNRESLGICLVGGTDKFGRPEDNFTGAQFATLKTLLQRLEQTYPGAEVLGHRDIPGVAKACPSFDVRAWWGALKDTPNPRTT
jgi:hypothetical protein